MAAILSLPKIPGSLLTPKIGGVFRTTVNRVKVGTTSTYNAALGTIGKKITAGALFLTSATAAVTVPTTANLIANAVAEGKYLSAFVCIGISFYTLYFTFPQSQNLICSILSHFQRKQKTPEMIGENEFPVVTVQIPARNEPFEVVRDTSLASALALDYPKNKLEIQVIDNSDKGLYTELEEYCMKNGINFIHRDGKEGAKARNLNIGLKHVNGELILLLDADCEFSSDSLKKMIPHFKDPSIGFVQSFLYSINRDDNFYTKMRTTIRDVTSKYLMPWKIECGFKGCFGHNVVIRKAALDAIGGWGEELVSEDYEAAINMLSHGYRGVFTTDPMMGDGVPNDFRRANIQQRKWGFGTTQLAIKKLGQYIKLDNISWNEKLDSVLSLPGYFTSTALFWIVNCSFSFFTAIASTIGMDISEAEASFFGMRYPFYLFIATNLILAARAFRDDKKEGLDYLKYFIPFIPSFAGHSVEVSKGVVAALLGKDDGWKITPKGATSKHSLANILGTYPIEFTVGSALMAAGSLLNFERGGWLYLIGAGLIYSPLTMWDYKQSLRSMKNKINAYARLSSSSSYVE